ncbi:unnamed protein product [Brassica napus]|uniref:(rape) hypothetical protein n=1 Tax=Brassica napus TaxID=3708 RepID=A0A816K7Z3_BRANA|nr:unnamed protein product [Brassica napus]
MRWSDPPTDCRGWNPENFSSSGFWFESYPKKEIKPVWWLVQVFQ